ncbi:hypothetical protein EYR38_010337 [Pleurotus pulmonarius]|nr:hypothetical protein EYR38_010337 [Pleurotus pulmonarius]
MLPRSATHPKPTTAAPSTHDPTPTPAAPLAFEFVAPCCAAVFVPLPVPPEVPRREEAAGEETVMPNADVEETERIVALPEAVPGANPEGKAREEEVEEVKQGSGELVDASGPIEKGEDAANSLLMSPTSVARRV